MEDLLEILAVVILAIVAGVIKSSKNRKKAADKPGSDQPVRPAQPTGQADSSAGDRKLINRRNVEAALAAFSELLEDEDLPDPDQPAPVKVREKTSIEAETAIKQRTELIQTRIQESLSGQSTTDAHGCIGGSMPEHSAEGETLAEHAGHERKRTERLQTEAAIRAESLRKPNLSDLRKAVVMAEILDKPVSMRRRQI